MKIHWTKITVADKFQYFTGCVFATMVIDLFGTSGFPAGCKLACLRAVVAEPNNRKHG